MPQKCIGHVSSTRVLLSILGKAMLRPGNDPTKEKPLTQSLQQWLHFSYT